MIKADLPPINKIKRSEFINSFYDKSYSYPGSNKSDPFNIQDRRIIFLRGYIGYAYEYMNDEIFTEPNKKVKSKSKPVPKAKWWRLFLTPELNSYIEFCEDYLLHVEDVKPSNGLDAKNIWLIAKVPRKNDGRPGCEIKEEEMDDIELVYGGYGYELSRTKHYIAGEMLAIMNAFPGGGGENTFLGCGPLTKNNVGCGPLTKNNVGCGPLTKNNVGCGPLTKNNVGCEGGGGGVWPLPTSILCEKYSTMIGCDEWDFRKPYYPY